MISLSTLLAACGDSNDPIGCLTAPTGVVALPTPDKTTGQVGLGPILSLVNIAFNLIFIVAGLFAFFQLIMAGYQFMNAGGDSKQVSAAWNKITQTFLGIIIMIGSFLISAIMGQIFFGDPLHFLRPTLFVKPSG